MTTKELINAIDECDDRFLIEAAEQKFTRTIGVWNAKKYRRFSKARIAAAVIICTLVVGTGVTVAAANSDAFYNWLKQTFMGYEVSKLTQSGETNVNSDENGFVSLIGDSVIWKLSGKMKALFANIVRQAMTSGSKRCIQYRATN